jgi:hypothetical protein
MIDAAGRKGESFYIWCIYPNDEKEKKEGWVQNAVKPPGE